MIVNITAGCTTTHRARIVLLHDVLHEFTVVGSTIDVLGNIFTDGLERWVLYTRLVLIIMISSVNTVVRASHNCLGLALLRDVLLNFHRMIELVAFLDVSILLLSFPFVINKFIS